MNKEQIKDKITELIVKDKLQDVFDILNENVTFKRETILLLNQRFSSIIHEYNKGLIDYSEKQKLVNHIVNSILEFLNSNDFDKSLKLSQNDIEIVESDEERISIRYIHYLSGNFYSINISNKIKASKLLEKIIELVETKHKMILKLKGGEDLKLDLFNETKEKIINLNNSIENNGIQENDQIALMIKTKKKKVAPNQA